MRESEEAKGRAVRIAQSDFHELGYMILNSKIKNK